MHACVSTFRIRTTIAKGVPCGGYKSPVEPMSIQALECGRMGLWDSLFSRRVSRDSAAGTYTQWVEPVLPAPTEDWERRLRAFGRRCARELEQAGVPKWTCREPRDNGTYREAFWVVSVDVEAANRYFALWAPQGATANVFRGSMRGYGLILSGAGGVFCSKVEIWFPPSGNHEEANLHSYFQAPTQTLLASSPWAARNIGRWRRKPDEKIYGAPSKTSCSEFKCDYPPNAFSNDNPGKGTSLALKRFVENGGRTQWPRNLANYP